MIQSTPEEDKGLIKKAWNNQKLWFVAALIIMATLSFGAGFIWRGTVARAPIIIEKCSQI